MNNVNASDHLHTWATDHEVDLAPFNDLVAELDATGRFAGSAQTEVAKIVLPLVQSGSELAVALHAARGQAIDSLNRVERSPS